jgi:hypothetical protein
MGLGSWDVTFVHPDENFKATAELYEHAKKLFERIGWPLIESGDEYGTWAAFNPIDPEVPISERDGGQRAHAPFTVSVWYSPRPVAGEDGMPRTFEVGYTFEAPPDLIKENDQTIETKLRANMKGIVEELEQLTGSRFVFRKFVGD